MVRQEHILEAAIKRFSHFGVSKTTLTEIADDLSMSKQSLFYYYPDKQHLLAAVEEKITTDYINALNQAFDKAGSIESALIKLLEIKKTFFEKYFMLAAQFISTDAITKYKQIDEVKRRLNEQEKGILAALFEKGIASGELQALDTEKTAGLLLDTLTAFNSCVSDRKGLPEPKDFEVLHQKQKDVMQLFYNGLKR